MAAIGQVFRNDDGELVVHVTEDVPEWAMRLLADMALLERASGREGVCFLDDGDRTDGLRRATYGMDRMRFPLGQFL